MTEMEEKCVVCEKTENEIEITHFCDDCGVGFCKECSNCLYDIIINDDEPYPFLELTCKLICKVCLPKHH